MSGICYFLAVVVSLKWVFGTGEYFWQIACLLFLGWVFS